MRGFATASGAVIAMALAAVAAPPSSSSRASDPQLRVASQDYASALLQVFKHIEEGYVRVVSRGDLAEAALTGLYEAVRQPVPPTLRQDVQNLNDQEMLSLLIRVRESLGDHDALRGGRAFYVSLHALPRALDQYCGVTGPKEFQALDLPEGTPQAGLEFPLSIPAPQSGGLSADGLRLDESLQRAARPSLPAGPVRVVGVQPGSPAQKAGIRPGDLVVRVDGRPPEDSGFAAAFQRLLPIRQGNEVDFQSRVSPIRLDLLRTGIPDPIVVTLVPAVFRAEALFGVRRHPDGSWDYLLDAAERIGYIRVGLIQSHSNADFAKALKALRAPKLRGLILDLRWCPGGFLDPAASITQSLLLKNQWPFRTQTGRADSPFVPIVAMAGLAGDSLSAVVATSNEFNTLRNKFGNGESSASDSSGTDFPIVVLINGETSGGGELIAAALQDHRRAVVAGQRTVGKASVQQPLGRYGIPFKITTSTLVRPSGKNMARLPDSKTEDDWGIRPDPGREIPASAELSRQLKSWWVLHALRPAGSVEALPLDDPENDPQRQAAVQMLKGLMAN